MSSFFKSKRSSTDAKSSSKSSNVTEPDSKTHKGPSSAAPSSKSSTGTVHSPPPVHTGGGVAPNSKQAAPPSQPKDRKVSVDMQDWLETECPVDSRIMAGTVQNNSLSISRSGRYKAKGKQRTRLFSAEDDGTGSPQDDLQAVRGSTTLSTPEDRQTVLDVMARRTGAAATPVQSPTIIVKQGPAGGNSINQESGANRKSSDRGTAASKWSATSNSTDL